VDRPDQRPRDLASQVAVTVKDHARPWRAIIALGLAVVAAVISADAGHTLVDFFEPGQVVRKIVTAASAAAFCLFATVAVLGLAGKSRQVLERRTGTAHAAVVRYTVLLVGGILILVITLSLLKIPIGQLVVGGAITTILLGIAAQQSLGNVFAGIVLLLARPFVVGDTVQFRSGSFGGPLSGTVTEIGITYVRVDTGDAVVHLPNSQVLAAGIGHLREAGELAAPAGQPAAPAAQPKPPGPP
jgi:small-conductance mechanosensitive channel